MFDILRQELICCEWRCQRKWAFQIVKTDSLLLAWNCFWPVLDNHNKLGAGADTDTGYNDSAWIRQGWFPSLKRFWKNIKNIPIILAIIFHIICRKDCYKVTINVTIDISWYMYVHRYVLVDIQLQGVWYKGTHTLKNYTKHLSGI